MFVINGNDASHKKWLTKIIEGQGSIEAKIKSLQHAGQDPGPGSKLYQRKTGYTNNLKGAIAEHKTYEELNRLFPKELYPDAEIVMKCPNTPGPDFIIKYTVNGQKAIKVVEVKNRKSLSMDDLAKYITKKKEYNIAGLIKDKGLLYLKDDNGNTIEKIDFDLYLYGENSEAIKEYLLRNLPSDRKLSYEYKSETGSFSGMCEVGIVTP